MTQLLGWCAAALMCLGWAFTLARVWTLRDRVTRLTQLLKAAQWLAHYENTRRLATQDLAVELTGQGYHDLGIMLRNRPSPPFSNLYRPMIPTERLTDPELQRSARIYNAAVDNGADEVPAYHIDLLSLPVEGEATRRADRLQTALYDVGVALSSPLSKEDLYKLAVAHCMSQTTVEHIVDSVMLRFADRMEQ